MHGHRATLARTTPCPCSGPADRARRRSTAASFCAVVADTYSVVGPGIVLPDHPPCDERPDCLLRNGAGQFAANQREDRSTMLRGLIAFCLLRRALVLIA